VISGSLSPTRSQISQTTNQISVTGQLYAPR
jgi:hypothetical protein